MIAQESLQEIRCRVIKDLKKQNDLKSVAYKNFINVLSNESEKPILITTEQLRTLKINEKVDVGNGVEFYKIREGTDEMVFHTIMEKGGAFSLHYHDVIEVCTVLEGELIETQRGGFRHERIYKKGERAIYDINETHSMYSRDYTLLEVRFLKNL